MNSADIRLDTIEDSLLGFTFSHKDMYVEALVIVNSSILRCEFLSSVGSKIRRFDVCL